MVGIETESEHFALTDHSSAVRWFYFRHGKAYEKQLSRLLSQDLDGKCSLIGNLRYSGCIKFAPE